MNYPAALDLLPMCARLAGVSREKFPGRFFFLIPMTINPSRIFSTLDDMEQLFVELDAEARGVCVEVVVCDLIRDGLDDEDMDEVSRPRDSQWKSH